MRSGGDAGKYQAPVTAFADHETFGDLLPLLGVRLSLPAALPTREVSWISVSLPCTSLPVPSVRGRDLLCSGVGLSEKMEMQFLGAQPEGRSAELPLKGWVVAGQLKALS